MRGQRGGVAGLVLCAFVAWASPAAGGGGEDAALRLLEEVALRNAGTTSLSADFLQEKHVSLLKRPLESHGFLCLRRQREGKNGDTAGERLLWAYTHPLRSGFVHEAGKGRLWEGDPSRARSADGREAALISGIVRHVLQWMDIDPQALRAAYRLEPGDEARSLRLFPRRPAFFARMDVSFSEDMTSVRRLSFVEAGGDVVRILFSSVEVNRPLPARCAAGEGAF